MAAEAGIFFPVLITSILSQEGVGHLKSFSTFFGLTSASYFSPTWGQAHALCTRDRAQSSQLSRASETALQRSPGWSAAQPRLSPWRPRPEREIPQAAPRCPPSLRLTHAPLARTSIRHQCGQLSPLPENSRPAVGFRLPALRRTSPTPPGLLFTARIHQDVELPRSPRPGETPGSLRLAPLPRPGCVT